MYSKEAEIKTKSPLLRSVEQFPWRCNLCAKKQVFPTNLHFEAEVRYDGRLVRFPVPYLEIPVCRACGEKVFTIPVDEQINAALRSHLHFSHPPRILNLDWPI